MQTEDCGACLQLTVRQALEAGVSKQIIEAGLNGGQGLTNELKDIYQFAVAVASNIFCDDELVERLERNFGNTVIAELALCIAGARVYPTIKRALGYAKSCSLITIEV